MKRYALTLVGVFATLFVAFSAFNLLVDPYGVVGLARIDRFNAVKTRQNFDGARVKLGFALPHAPATVLIGNSRVGVGFRGPPPWGGEALNAGMGSSNAFELGRALALAGRSDRLRCVVLTLEMEDYDAVNKVKGAYWLSPLADGSESLALLRMATSRRTLGRSFETVHDNLDGERPSDQPWLRVYRPGQQRHRFELAAAESWRGFYSYAYDPERLHFLMTAVDRLTARGVQVITLFTPSHAWHDEAVFRAGADQTLFRWRRDVMTALEPMRGRTPAAPCVPGGSVVSWDFSGFQPPSLAAWPTADQTRPHPTYYESSHFTPAIGARVMARLAGTGQADFGTPVTAATLPQADAAIRARRAAWLHTAQGIEATAWFDAVARRERPRPVSERFYVNRDDWSRLDKDLLLIRGPAPQAAPATVAAAETPGARS